VQVAMTNPDAYGGKTARKLKAEGK